MYPDQLKCIQLRDCFYAGYSMPQYCIDNGIKRPLIASYDPEFLWELYVQFRYDKRIAARFCVLSNESATVSHGVYCVINGQTFEKVNFNDLGRYDRIIALTTLKMSALPADRTIYLDALFNGFVQYVYAERPLYSYLNTHKGVKLVVTTGIAMKVNEHTTEYEKTILKKGIHRLRDELKVRGDRVLKTRFDQFGYSNEEVYAMLVLSDARTNPDGTSDLVDNDNPLVMTEGGIRKTAYQHGEYKNTVWCMGTCIYYGIGAPYNKTIESYLQKIFNENGHEYRVENVSQFYSGRYQDIFYNLNKLPVKDGDIVLICLQDLKSDKLPFFDWRPVFTRPHNYGEVFADIGHLNERGNKIVAEKLYEYLKENNFFKDYKYDIPTNFPAVHQYGIVKTKSGGVLSANIKRSLSSISRSSERFGPPSAV